MKAWITKYALTKGIYMIEAKASHTPTMICGPNVFENYHGEGKEWHRTEKAARQHAEDMRAAKLSSLARQIDKLKKIVF